MMNVNEMDQHKLNVFVFPRERKTDKRTHARSLAHTQIHNEEQKFFAVHLPTSCEHQLQMNTTHILFNVNFKIETDKDVECILEN